MAPFIADHLYVQWGGKLPGNEQWSCGVRMYDENLGTIGDQDTMIAGITAAITAYHQSSSINISGNAKLSFVKVNRIDAITGRYQQQKTTQTLLPDLPGGGSATPVYPNQVALAVSLTTGFSRGPAHRGRFYLPIPNLGVTVAGVIAAENADAVSDATDVWINAMNAVDPNWKMAVFSRKYLFPAVRVVTGNEVGRVLDTQRRRRRSLVEDYQ